MGAWLTIDEPGEVVCRALSIPLNFLPHVMGALGDLCEASNWEQSGELTPEECAELMAQMWEGIEEC